jgi:hypothetical protein
MQIRKEPTSFQDKLALFFLGLSQFALPTFLSLATAFAHSPDSPIPSWMEVR